MGSQQKEQMWHIRYHTLWATGEITIKLIIFPSGSRQGLRMFTNVQGVVTRQSCV